MRILTKMRLLVKLLILLSFKIEFIMARSKEEILEDNGAMFVWSKDVPNVHHAMDDYAKEMCLDLLDYMAKNRVICNHDMVDNYFMYRGQSFTKEQIFENFL